MGSDNKPTTQNQHGQNNQQSNNQRNIEAIKHQPYSANDSKFYSTAYQSQQAPYQSSAAQNSNNHNLYQIEGFNNSTKENQPMVGASLIIPDSNKLPPSLINSSQSGAKKDQTLSYINGASAHSINRQGKQRIVQLHQSKVYLKSEKAASSESVVEAFRIKGFKNEQYIGRNLKQFQLSVDPLTKDLIKEQDYFDESNGPIGLQPELNTSYADFRLGDMNQLTTFPAKAYLFNVTLMEKIVS